MLAAPAASAAIGADAFLASPAAQAYKQGDYEHALAELQLLLQEHPDDVVILRYLGMASHKLGRFAEAGRFFAQALALQPDSAAIHYWLGSTYYELQRAGEAEDSFRRVLALDPESTYAANAREWLAVLEQGAAAAAVRPWTLSLQVGLQYDDNVALTPGDGDGSFRFVEQLSGSYTVFEAAGWALTLAASTDHSQHTDPAVDDFDVNSAGGSAEIRYGTQLLGAPVFPGLRYVYDLDHVGGDRFSETNTISPFVETNLTPDSATALFYEFAFADFDDDGFDPAIASRDGDYQSAGLIHTQYFDQNRHSVWGSYGYEQIAAEGLNFDAEGHRLAIGFAATLPFALELDGSGAWAHDDYPRYQGPRDRVTDRWSFSLGLSREIAHDMSVSVRYAYTDEDSNYAPLGYERQIATLLFMMDF